MRAKAYPKYRQSGVEWLGEVPEDWDLKKLKHSCQLMTLKTESRQNPVALENIESWTGRFVETESEFEGEGIAFIKKDILFGKLRPYLAKVLKAEKDGEAVGDFFVLRPSQEVVSDYMAFLLRSEDYIKIIDGSTFGSKMPRASWDFMGSLPIPVPPLSEQQSIASFLDRETGRIDALIGKKQRLVELVKEKRTALISRAVTKGLDPKVKMKPSGVEWLGEVPEYWETIRLKFLLQENLMYGANESAEDDNPDNPRFIRITDIDDNGQLRHDTFKSLPREVAGPYLLVDGDILLARSGATVGKSIRYRKSWGDCCFAGYLIRARVEKTTITPEFLDACCQSAFYWQYIVGSQIQATIQNVSAEKYANLILPVPPLREQQSISSFLSLETSKLDALISKVNQAILTLKEYRTALISAAVTGKIEIKDEVGRMKDEIETKEEIGRMKDE